MQRPVGPPADDQLRGGPRQANGRSGGGRRGRRQPPPKIATPTARPSSAGPTRGPSWWSWGPDVGRLRPGERTPLVVPAGIDRRPEHRLSGVGRRDDLCHAGDAETAVGGPPRRAGQAPGNEIVWRLDQGTPDNATPVVWGQSLFVVTNNGAARCVDISNGRVRWKDAAEGRVSRLAGGGRGPHLFSQHQGPLHGPLGRAAIGPPYGKPA